MVSDIDEADMPREEMEDFLCPECGVRFSSAQPAEMFDGFEEDIERRACLYDGRVFIHSSGDIRGYPPDAEERPA